MKLRNKLWLIIVLSSIVSVAMLVGFTFLIGALFSDGYTHKQLTSLGEEWVAELQEAGSDHDQIQHLLDTYKGNHPEVSLSVLSADGDILFTTLEHGQKLTFREGLDHFVGMPNNMWQSGKKVSFVFSWVHEGNTNYLLMELPSDVMLSNQVFLYVRDNASLLQLVIPILLFFLTPYAIAIAFFSRMNRRLSTINQAMTTFDAQGTQVVLKDASRDEIEHLARHFNHMTERIREQIAEIQTFDAKRKSLIANISHDLRTPMTFLYWKSAASNWIPIFRRWRLPSTSIRISLSERYATSRIMHCSMENRENT